MDSSSDRRAARTELHEKLSLALASSRLHKRLHDPNRILADAAADELLECLALSGFVMTDAVFVQVAATATSRSDELQP